MRYFRKLSFILLMLATILSGCTKSHIVSPEESMVKGDGQPNFEVNKNIDIDWIEVREDLRDEFVDPYGEFGDYVLDMKVIYDNKTQLLTVLLPVTHEATGDIAVLYGEAVLKAVGTSIATQNFYYEAADEEDTENLNYGSYFDEHDVCVQVFPYDKEGDTSAYFVNDIVKAGEHRALTAQIQ